MSKLLVDEISDADNTGPVTVTDGAVVNRIGDGTIIDLQSGGTTVGSIGVAAGNNLTFGATASGHAGIYLNDDGILPMSANTVTDNSVDFGSSAYRFKDLYLSGGVYLGGTGSANHLDDYEEGTWTPTVLFYSGTITVNAASYRKIGSIVHAFCDITFSATVDADRIDLVSLPFAIATDASLANLGGGFTTYNGSGVQINFSANGAINRMQAFNNSGNEVTYTNVSGKRLRISFCYQSA
jgi:hypothetical protein